MPVSSRFLTLAVLAALLVPSLSVAQDTPVRMRASPTLTRATPASSETLPVQRIIAQVRPEADGRPPFVRTSGPIAPLSLAQRVAIMAEEMDLSDNARPSISDLTLTVQKPYTPNGWLTFQDVTVEPRYNYALVGPQSYNPSASIRMGFKVQAGQRYLVDYQLYLSARGTVSAGGSISATRRLESGSQRLLFVVEAQHDGILTLSLQGVDVGFVFDGVVVSRME